MNAKRPGLYLQQTDEEREDTKEGIQELPTLPEHMCSSSVLMGFLLLNL
jgi:hypothetical protein